LDVNNLDRRNTQRWVTVIAAGAAMAYVIRNARDRSDTRAQLGGSRGILVDEAVTIKRPVSDVYRFWQRFDEFPRFMTHLVSVTTLGGGLSRWVAKAPAGTTVEWNARVINEIENELIAWQSVEGSTIATAGSVRFTEDSRGTSVRVRLQYNPPAGKAGAAVARLFGEEPRLQVREDLRRFKQLMETGEIATTEGQSSGRRGAGRRSGRLSARRRTSGVEAI
jgi:uncharacterized membrane protein